jgi:hypothetical protein
MSMLKGALIRKGSTCWLAWQQAIACTCAWLPARLFANRNKLEVPEILHATRMVRRRPQRRQRWVSSPWTVAATSAAAAAVAAAAAATAAEGASKSESAGTDGVLNGSAQLSNSASALQQADLEEANTANMPCLRRFNPAAVPRNCMKAVADRLAVERAALSAAAAGGSSSRAHGASEAGAGSGSDLGTLLVSMLHVRSCAVACTAVVLHAALV